MNGFCHIEIPSRDFDKAKKFYGELFKWEFDFMKDMDYLLFKAPDGVGGGFSKNLVTADKPGFLFYIEVDDLDATIRKSQELGTKTLREKTQISPEHGYIASIADLEGNQIGLWSKK